MAGAEQLTADLADQRDFRQMLGVLAHHSRQEAPQEYSVFTEEPTEEGKEVAGGGASRQVSKGYFERFCDGVERTLRHNLAANQPGKDFADVEPVCIVDFAFGDENGLNLKDSDQLLERAHCFIDRHDRAGGTRLFVLHVHTMCKWSEAKHMPPRERVQKITSVNVRHAHQPRKRAPLNTTASTRAAAQRDQRAAEPRPVSAERTNAQLPPPPTFFFACPSCHVCLGACLVLPRVPGPPFGVTRLGSPASPRMVPVDAAACRAYRDPRARNHS